MQRGRKSKREDIENNLEKIKEWVGKGLTEKQIAKNLGMAYSTFNKYKKENVEFSELLKKGRKKPVEELENALYSSALGFTQKVKKAMKIKKIEYEDGKKKKEIETIEYYEEEVYYPPNCTAAIYLLKHWGKNYTNDPEVLKLKKREMDLKEKLFSNQNW